MSKLQTHYQFKPDFQTVDQHTGGKWFIHGTKHHKYNLLQSLELPVEYPNWDYKLDIKKSHCNMSNPVFQK